MALSKEQIFAAADSIAAAGKKPTLEAIRQIVGGSYSTISPALQAWKAQSSSAAAAPIREPAPAAITEKLVAAGNDAWSFAQELANTRLKADREALDQVRVTLEADRVEAMDIADRVTLEAEALREALAAATEEKNEAISKARAATEQAHTAEARAIEIEKRAGELRAELDRAHQESDAAHAEAAQHLQALQALQARFTDAEAAAAANAAEAQQRLTEATAAAAAAAAENRAVAERAEARALEIEKRAEEMRSEIERAKKEAAEAQQSASTAREDAALLRGQLQATKEATADIIARLTPAPAPAPAPARGRVAAGAG